MGKGCRRRPDVKYRPARIVWWMHNYRTMFDSARGERSLYWAEVKADILWAVRHCSEDARIVFQLYCLDGMDYSEIFQMMRLWSFRRLNTAVRELVDVTVGRLMDDSWQQGRRIEPPYPLPEMHEFDPGIPVRP